MLPDDEIAEGRNSFNSMQREVFNVVHALIKDYVKYNELKLEPIQILLSGRGETDKFLFGESLSL